MININFLSTQSFPKGISILVSDPNKNNILLDLGPSILDKLYKIDTFGADIQNIFVSHIHADHSSGLPLIFWSNIMERFSGKVTRKGMLNLIGLDSALLLPLEYCKASYPLLWNENPMVELKHHIFTINQQINLDLGWIKIESFATDHTVPSAGIIITKENKKIVFTSDTRLTENVKKVVRNADLLICSVFGSKNTSEICQKFGFMTSEDAGLLANFGNVKKLVMIHIDNENQKNQCFIEAKEKFKGEILIPIDFEEIVV